MHYLEHGIPNGDRAARSCDYAPDLFDSDLAELYGVANKALIQAVKPNINSGVTNCDLKRSLINMSWKPYGF